MDSTVDLPQPEWPIIDTNSPFLILRLNSSTTVRGPLAVGYTLLTLKNSRYLDSPGFFKKGRRAAGVSLPAGTGRGRRARSSGFKSGS